MPIAWPNPRGSTWTCPSAKSSSGDSCPRGHTTIHRSDNRFGSPFSSVTERHCYNLSFRQQRPNSPDNDTADV
jgi:hypothetical protein